MSNHKSFTLIELLVVIAIIGVLSAIVITSISGAVTKSRIVRLQVFSDTIRAQLSDSLVSYWSFNEGTGVTAYDQWEGNNGTLGGDPEWKSGGECVSGKCLEFDGSGDYVDCGSDDSLDSLDYFTISLWVKSLDNNAIIAQGIIAKANISGDENGWMIDKETDNKFHFRSGPHHVRNQLGAYSDIAYTDISWHHLVSIHNDIQNYLYIDGEKQSAIQNTTFTSMPNISLVIATRYGDYPIDTNYSRRFNGLIDEVHIYNSAVSVTQIQLQYLAGLDKLLSNGAISKSEYNQRIKELSRSLVNE